MDNNCTIPTGEKVSDGEATQLRIPRELVGTFERISTQLTQSSS